jgi:hypothetical protein
VQGVWQGGGGVARVCVRACVRACCGSGGAPTSGRSSLMGAYSPVSSVPHSTGLLPGARMLLATGCQLEPPGSGRTLPTSAGSASADILRCGLGAGPCSRAAGG